MRRRLTIPLWPLVSSTSGAAAALPNLNDPNIPFSYAVGNGGVTDAGQFLFMPFRYYPFADIDQMILQWNISAMPTAATYVSLTPISFDYLDTTGAFIAVAPGIMGEGGTGGQFVGGYARQYDQLGNPMAGQDLTEPYAITRAAIDVVSGVGGRYRIGTNHPIPFIEPYIGFLVNTDGTDQTGAHFASVVISFG